MSASTSSDFRKPIKGAVLQINTPEAAALWRQSPYLRPGDHGEWLRHFINLEFNFARLQCGWIPAVAPLEWKLEIPRFVFEDMQRVHRMLERLEEMPKAKSKPTETAPQIQRFLDAIGPCEHGATFFHTLYGVIKPALATAYDEYIQRSDALLDAPVAYTLRSVVDDLRRQIDEAQAFFMTVPHVAGNQAADQAYQDFVRECLKRLGGLSFQNDSDFEPSVSPVGIPAGPSPEKVVHDPRMRLLEKEHFPSDKENNPFASTIHEIVYHNATEWQVVAPMCYVFHDVAVMPIEFYIDFSRHIWDECRHALMGLRRMRELGYDRDDFAYPNGGDKPTSPEDYVASLTLIGEACSFNRKRGSIVPFLQRGDYRSAMLPEVDCNDEQMHVRYGHKWVPEIYFRTRAETRQIKEIGEDVRRAFLANIERLPEASEEERKRILANLPTFCSAIEFSHLDFTQDAILAGAES